MLKTLFISILIVPTAFAEKTLAPFNLHGTDINNPKPNTEESYFATRAPMPSEIRRYLGINAGLNYTTLKPKITKNTINDSISNAYVFGFTAGAYGGLGTNLDHFYIGAELNGSYNSLDRKINSPTTNINIAVTQPIVAGLDIIPGYLTQNRDLLLYGRFGMAASLFKFKPNNNSDTKKIALGWRAGLGMEYFMNETFSARIEYVFNNYCNIKKNYTTTESSSYEFFSPKTQQVILGLTLNF